MGTRCLGGKEGNAWAEEAGKGAKKRMNEVEGISLCRRTEAGIWGFETAAEIACSSSCSCRRHLYARLDDVVVFVGIERVHPAQMVKEPRPRGAAIVASGAVVSLYKKMMDDGSASSDLRI
jgi:hypothetical protein